MVLLDELGTLHSVTLQCSLMLLDELGRLHSVTLQCSLVLLDELGRLCSVRLCSVTLQCSNYHTVVNFYPAQVCA